MELPQQRPGIVKPVDGAGTSKKRTRASLMAANHSPLKASHSASATFLGGAKCFVRQSFLEMLRESKVADFDKPAACEENVGGLDAAVANPYGVDVVERENHLRPEDKIRHTRVPLT